MFILETKNGEGCWTRKTSSSPGQRLGTINQSGLVEAHIGRRCGASGASSLHVLVYLHNHIQNQSSFVGIIADYVVGCCSCCRLHNF